MTCDVEFDENIILLCLGSNIDDEASLCQLESAGIDVYEFDDADEYILYLLSLTNDEKSVIVWLGSDWNHLISILDDFLHIYCSYLSSKPTEQILSLKVHGVFTDSVELVRQVLIDAQKYQSYYSTHLNVLDFYERSMTLNMKMSVSRSMWTTVLMQVLLHMPFTTTTTTNMYQDMLDEARFFYKNNPTQLSNIDKFEKEYRKEDAINWYSRDSFTYRLMNKAFRTENLATIFKFRAFICDVYEQLQKLHQQQNLTTKTNNPQQSMIKVYRAMKVSTAEGSYLQTCPNDSVVSLNSFVSTSKNPEVAAMFLGTDPEKEIMLEISIDLNSIDVDSSPFADIAALSANPHEEEVLLSMGTILQIESKSIDVGKKITFVKARVCENEISQVKELRKYYVNRLTRGKDESYYMCELSDFLFLTFDNKKIQQLRKFLKRNFKNESDMNDVNNFTFEFVKSFQDFTRIGFFTMNTAQFVAMLSKVMQNFVRTHNFANFLHPELSELSDFLMTLTSAETLMKYFYEPEKLFDYTETTISSIKQLALLNMLPTSHPVNELFEQLANGMKIAHNGPEKMLESLEKDQSSSIALLTYDDMNVMSVLTNIALTNCDACTYGNHSLQLLENLNNSSKPQPTILRQLARYHEKHDDLPKAITYYRSIIEKCDLPPNSKLIVQTYQLIGDAFTKLNDHELALLNYHQAHQLLFKHYESTDPYLRSLETLIKTCEHQIQIKQKTT